MPASPCPVQDPYNSKATTDNVALLTAFGDYWNREMQVGGRRVDDRKYAGRLRVRGWLPEMQNAGEPLPARK